MRYLLDTNICIYLLRRRPAKVVSRLESLREGDVSMSAVTYAELCAGLEIQAESREEDRAVLAQLTQRIPVLPVDEQVAMRYGVVRAAVPDRRRDAFDRLIAAHAISLGVTLVTNNEADFAGYPGLLVENWAA